MVEGMVANLREPRVNRRPLGARTGLEVSEVGIGLWAVALRRRRRAPEAVLPDDYRKALHWLARRGHPRPATSTAQDFVRDLGQSLDPLVSEAFSPITDRYLASRFGGAGTAEEALRNGDLARLRAALRSACPTVLERAVGLVGLRDHAHVRHD